MAIVVPWFFAKRSLNFAGFDQVTPQSVDRLNMIFECTFVPAPRNDV